MLLGGTKLNTIQVLISKALIDSYINYDQFDSVKNVLREYNEMKEEIKNPENDVEYVYYIKTMETYCISCKEKYCQQKYLIVLFVPRKD